MSEKKCRSEEELGREAISLCEKIDDYNFEFAELHKKREIAIGDYSRREIYSGFLYSRIHVYLKWIISKKIEGADLQEAQSGLDMIKIFNEEGKKNKKNSNVALKSILNIEKEMREITSEVIEAREKLNSILLILEITKEVC